MKRPVLMACLLAVSFHARAEEAAQRPWKNAAELSLTNTAGNTRLTTLDLDDTFNYAGERNGLELKAGVLASWDQGQAKDEEYDASEKGTREISGAFYGYEKFGWDKDRFEGINNRYESFAGIGDKLLSASKDGLVAELGGGYLSEERPDKTDDFAAGRLYAKYTRTLSSTASFSQDAEYLYSFKDGADYRLNTETALVASINAYVSLKASFKWRRLAKPAPGFVQDDTFTGAALVVNY